MMARPRIAVVVITWNSADDVAACLDSLIPSDPGVEVVVVDNGSTDQTVKIARGYSGVRVIVNEKNRGLAAANNQGLAATTADVIVLSNADIIFHPGCLDAIRSTFDRRPRAALLAIRVIWPDGVVQTSTGDLPGLGEALLGRQVQRARSQGTPRGYCWDGWAHDEERFSGRAGDACYAARRTAIAEIGAQDERFPLDWEAIDWSRRMRTGGWEVWFTPSAVVTHAGGGSTSHAPSWRYIRETHIGMARYFNKTSPRSLRPLIGLAFAARAIIKWLINAAGVPMWALAHRGRE